MNEVKALGFMFRARFMWSPRERKKPGPDCGVTLVGVGSLRWPGVNVTRVA